MPRCEVRDWIDVYYAQQTVARFATGLGFSRRECSELAIVASELVSNILKYGVRGSLDMDSVLDGLGSGLVLIASDCGPPFRNLSAALLDGHDDDGPIDPVHMLKRKGIGGGLGAVLRLSHSFRVEPLPVGKKVHVVRYVGKKTTR